MNETITGTAVEALAVHLGISPESIRETEYHCIYEATLADGVTQNYYVMDSDEANDELIYTIESEPHRVSVDRLKPFLPDHVDIEGVQRLKDDAKKEVYDEIVNYLLQCAGKKDDFVNEVYQSYPRSYFLSDNDTESMVNGYLIFRQPSSY